MNKISLKELKFDSNSVAMAGMFVAMEIVLSRFFSISAWNIKIGFGFVPVVIAAMLLGPVKGGIVAALGDFFGAILFPIGAYFPGFTLTAFVTGIVYGVFLHEKQSIARISVAIGINQLVLSLLLNTFWISILYGAPYKPLLLTRMMQCVFLIPVQLVTIFVISKSAIRKLAFQVNR
ncbi:MULTISPECIES: folate family ECF transporter S component [unclassified Sedimentibacter]|uniref:folate family ECF transporter S component n=1 Tax=unclassified Sedimentibacter TaxID=2649220 RepID=UPI0027E03804|nr:folate family ECF transporter S component [Sedimentibacter sp. MB35-C1]WMJ75971.1 folate family ECF transporter S component [Sedimentibacter sp. MB35-C1]